MPSFRVWAPHDGDRPTKPNVVALDHESAALHFVETRHADFDYASDVEVRVDDERGHQFVLHVRASTETTFRVVGDE